MNLALAFIGLLVGVATVGTFGVIKGLFGRTALYVLFGILFIMLIVSTFSSGVESSAESLLPLAYWGGLTVGSLIGLPISDEVERALQVNGKPRLQTYIHGNDQ